MKFNPNTVQSRMESPLGPILLAASETGLQGAWFIHNQRHLPDSSAWPVTENNPFLLRGIDFLQRYFAGEAVKLEFPLDMQSGTPFQKQVWQALLQIPRGSVTSYGQLSTHIGNPNAVRAVGGAVGHNPLSIIVPCHRVIGADGSLTGYAGGLDRKVVLLRLEGLEF